MWGGLANPTSPAGVGLIRALCYTKTGRQSVGNTKQVIESLCNMSRSSDDWQYMAIDSLLLLLKDPVTRHRVIDLSAHFLVDLVELNNLKGRNRVGEAITQTLLQDFHKIKYGNMKLKSKKTEKALEEIWDLKVERRKKEKLTCEEELIERKVMVGKFKQQGNEKFWSGSIEEAVKMYSKALDLCPVKMVKERVVLHSNRSQCYLLLNKAESAVSDTTRALCLSGEVRAHSKSLWRRSQAYDMLGLEKESLMDCLTFVSSRMKSKRVKIPYYAAVMINKQMSATWPFNEAKSPVKIEKIVPGMTTIIEEHLIERKGKKRNGERGRGRKSTRVVTGGPMRPNISH